MLLGSRDGDFSRLRLVFSDLDRSVLADCGLIPSRGSDPKRFSLSSMILIRNRYILYIIL